MAGLKPDEYWDCSFCDVIEVVQADEMNKVHDWRLNREITYVIYCANTLVKDRVSKQEWLTLPGELVASAEGSKREMVQRWKQMGYLA